jgi:hypothetical protein
MILQTRLAILLLSISVLVGSGQTCREQSSNSNANGSTPASVANMSIQNTKKESKPNAEEGVWGGPHVRLVLTLSGGEIEFDCGHGLLNEPLKRDAQGRFAVAGTFVREGGPVRQEESAGKPARYSGRIEGDSMTLTLTLSDSNEPDEFTLTRGSDGRLWKCK